MSADDNKTAAVSFEVERDDLSSAASKRSEKLGAPESVNDYEVLQIDAERVR